MASENLVLETDPNILSQLNSSVNSEETDPNILSQLNGSNNNINPQNTSFLGALGRSIVPGVVDPVLNLIRKTGDLNPKTGVQLPEPLTSKNFIPEYLRPTKDDSAHPVAQFIGRALGYLLPGLGEVKATSKLLPFIGKLDELAKTSTLGRIGSTATHGAIQGGAYSDPGNTKKGIGEGLALGAAGGLLHSSGEKLGSGVKNLWQASVRRGPLQKELSTASENVKNALEEKENANASQAKLLGVHEEAQPLMREHIIRDFNEIKKPISGMYDQVKEDLYGLKINLKNAMSDEESKNAIKVLKESTPTSKEDQILTNDLGNEKSTKVSGTKLIDMYKAARDRAAYSQGKMFQRNIGEDKRLEFTHQYKKLKPIADKFESILTDQLPPETLELLRNADSEWQKKVVPFYESDVFHAAENGKKLPSDLMTRMAGEESHNKSMRELVLRNPELTRLSIGEKYSKNPEKLLETNPYAEPYIKSHQEILQGIERQKSALEREKLTKEQHEKLSEELKKHKETGAKFAKYSAIGGSGALGSYALYAEHRKLYDLINSKE